MTIKYYPFMSFALCKDNTSIDFFSDKIDKINEAIKFCQDCPVKDPCFQYAVEQNIVHGIFGGQTARARKRARAKLKLNQVV